MQKDIKELINKWGIIIFSSLWILLLTSTYFVHNKYMSKALQVPHFLNGIFVLFIAFAIFVFIHSDKKQSSFKTIVLQKINGWKTLLFFFISTILYYTLYGSDIKAFEEVSNSYVIDYSMSWLFHMFLLILFLFSAFILGDFILSKVPHALSDNVSKGLIGLALGIIVFVLYFFALAFFKLFILPAILIATLIPLALFYKKTIEKTKLLFIQPIESFEIQAIGLFAFFVFVFYLVATITVSFRPIPIGFDELSIYMNTPKIIAQSHSLVKGGQAYNWSLMMAVGFLFEDGVTMATLLSVIPSVFTFVTIYKIASYSCSKSTSILAATSFYIIPTFLWQSCADSKVDMALCLFICTMILFLVASYKKLEQESASTFKSFFTSAWFTTSILLAVLAAFSFGIKYTAVFFVLATIVAFVFLYSRSFALSASAFFVSIAILFISKVYSFSGIVFSDLREPKMLTALSSIVAIALLVFYMVKHKFKNLIVLAYIAFYFLCMGIVFSPWLIKNYNESHKTDSTSLLNGDTQRESLIEQISKVKPFSSELAHSSSTLLAQQSSASDQVENKYSEKAASGVYEEILRYLGYENGFVKYASVIYDMATFKNVATLPTDIGLICLVLLPLLFINSKKEYLVSNIANIAIVFFMLCLSLYTVFIGPKVNLTAYSESLKNINPNSIGLFKQLYMLIQPLFIGISTMLTSQLEIFTKQNTFQSFLIILILVSLLAVINLKQIKQWSIAQQVLLFFIASAFVFWWMLGNAISWYGIAIFGAAIVLFISLHLQERESNPVLFYIFQAVFVIYLSTSLLHRSSSMVTNYEYDSKLNKIFLQFAGHSTDESSALQDVNPAIAAARDEINTNPTKKVLRIGTSMNYFIDQNNTRVFEDNQLDNFTFIYNRYYGVKDVMNTAMKKVGIEYVLFDLNTGSIDKTPDKSLTKKIEKFYDYVSNNRGITLITSDRLMVDPYSKNYMMVQGAKTPVSYSIYGTQVLKPGSLVLFKIN